MNLLKRTVAVLKNRYVITLLAMGIWLLFFDRNNLFSQVDRHREVKKLESEAAYYKAQIEENKTELSELRSDPAQLEKFAREHYLMKKDNEDVFVIVRDSVK